MATQSIFKSPAGEKAVMAFYDSVLARWPVPYETLNIPTRHGNTFVIACGEASAPSLILLHGAGTNSAIWLGDVAEYSRYYRVYAIDLLGEAGKSAPNRPAWNSPAYAEWLEELFDALQLEKATLLGISQGAWTALKFSVYKPQSVEKLVLLTPGGIVPDRYSFLLRAIFYSLLGEWGIRRIVRLVYGSQPIPEGVEEVTMLVTRNFKARVGVLPLFSDEELQRLTMPTLLLIGDEDALRDANKIISRMQPLLPDLTATILPKAGHALLQTREQIMPFLITDSTQREL